MKPSLRKFEKTGAQPLFSDTSRRVPKEPIPGPTSPLRLFYFFLFSLLKKTTFIDGSVKASLYICTAAAGSLLFHFIKLPSSYFSNKQNMFNLIFVKWGWAWTFCLLAMFIILSAYIYTGSNTRLLRAHLMRLLAGSLCWYVCTSLFNSVEASIGQCFFTNGTIMKSINTRPFVRRSCRTANGHWLGFDISGHCFLLVMCNLWIIEELKVFRFWSVLGRQLQVNTQSANSMGNTGICNAAYNHLSLSEQDFNRTRISYIRLNQNLHVIFILNAFLSVLWDFMFICTIAYFHTMPSKLLGTAIGIACWMICYKFIFPTFNIGNFFGLFPGLPGDGPLHFVTRR